MVSKLCAFVSLFSVAFGVRKLDKGIEAHRHSRHPLGISYLLINGGTPDGLEGIFAQNPACNYTGSRESQLYTQIPDECCLQQTWTGAGVSPEAVVDLPATNVKDGETYTCTPLSLGPIGPANMARGYLACEDSQPVWAESCFPAGISPGNGWPMTASVAATEWDHGTYESCGCHAPKFVGEGCYAGQTFPGFAYYAYLQGDGCKAEDQQPPVETASPESEIQYFRFPDHNEIAALMPQCDFWKADEVGRKVPDECCDTSSPGWNGRLTSTPPDARTPLGGGDTTTCYVRARAPPNDATYIRNFFGCESGALLAAEECMPKGALPLQDYPMNETYAATQSVNGDIESCNCGTIYGRAQGTSTDSNFSPGGEGCYVAATSFTAFGAPDPTTNYLKISGTCSAA